ncbi:MAG: hypothetical protein JJU08_00525, partial [Rhodobacteraceae bacterium]|nr:hypothetical protein [Paracoccaceae bacterium]
YQLLECIGVSSIPTPKPAGALTLKRPVLEEDAYRRCDFISTGLRHLKPVPERILAQLAESAKDPGAMMATQSLRGQIEPLWLDALDALIEKLKAVVP